MRSTLRAVPVFDDRGRDGGFQPPSRTDAQHDVITFIAPPPEAEVDD